MDDNMILITRFRKLQAVFGQMEQSGAVVALNITATTRESAALFLAGRFGAGCPVVWSWAGSTMAVVEGSLGHPVWPGFDWKPARYVSIAHANGGGKLLYELARAVGLHVIWDGTDDHEVQVWFANPDPRLGRQVMVWCYDCDDIRDHTVVGEGYPTAPGGFLAHCNRCGGPSYVDVLLLSD
jgi:hypothetical protein